MPGSELRLLALDGGGVRGLSALMILERLMEAVDPSAPPKPCEYFDMIGGTSTGGLIAVMLGRLRMSVADCITAYLLLSERVFRKRRHRVTVRGKVQGRFDSEELARAVKEVVHKQGLPEDALLKDESNSTCKVFVCATSKETSETVCLTSYRTPRGNSDLLKSVTIWEACRATSAASSFFDPITVGRFGEGFVDGATGANNPVREVWDQAQVVWGPEPLEGKVMCLVSIGTGLPSLKPFKDDVLHIGQALVAIATDTEQTAERFQRERPALNSTGRYYRFNVDRGLEDVGLEEAKKVTEIAAATRRYIATQAVLMRMQACAGSIASRGYSGEYQVAFSLEGVPRVRQFVDRSAELEKLEKALLSSRESSGRQKIHVLHGLGGMGKTQLAVEFARRHYQRFSAVLWLDGRSEDSLKRSIAVCAGRIPQGQIPEVTRGYATDSGVGVDAVVKDVMGWLARPGNSAWLLIFDNVDREYTKQGGDPDAYDVKHYLSGADHGSVLMTTRLAKLGQLDQSPQQLGKVDDEQAQAILKAWYKKPYDTAEGDRLLRLLDGLPLAIAQAGAYLEESGVRLARYLRFYEQQWDKLMKADSEVDAPLHDYPDRSVWTTWAISYQAIRDKCEHTANLLLLWSFLDNKDLWHGLFADACKASAGTAKMLTTWVGEIASSEVVFSQAIRLLRNYSLIEEMEETESYTIHPVVHRWAYHYQGKRCERELGLMAVVAVGWAVPDQSARDYMVVQRRLLAHAHALFLRLMKKEISWDSGNDKQRILAYEVSDSKQVLLNALDRLGILFASAGKLVEAGQMYRRALEEKEETLGPEHLSTLNTVGNLGNLYKEQGKLVEAEQMYKRALQGYNVLEPKSPLKLRTVGNLGLLYKHQGRLEDAEPMYVQALQGFEQVLGSKHLSTLQAINNLGVLYKVQGKLTDAERMHKQALKRKVEVLGSGHPSTLQTIDSLGVVYTKQGKLAEAEQMYEQALQGKEAALGLEHYSTLQTVGNLGNLYHRQGKLADAERMLGRALQGYENALGYKHTSTLNTINSLGILYKDQRKLAESEKMLERALHGRIEALGSEHASTFETINNLGLLYAAQGKLAEAQQMYERALQGYEEALGPKHTSTLDTVNDLGDLYKDQGKLAEAQQMYERALQGYEEALGHKDVQQYTPALNTMKNLGDLYREQGKHAEAQEMYLRVLPRLQSILGESSERCRQLEAEMYALSTIGAREAECTQLLVVEEARKLRPQHELQGSRRRLRQYVRDIFQ